MTITAKFSTICPVCGQRIATGQKVNWIRGSAAQHVSCPVAAAPAVPSVPQRGMGAAWGQRPSRMSRREYEFSRDDN